MGDDGAAYRLGQGRKRPYGVTVINPDVVSNAGAILPLLLPKKYGAITGDWTWEMRTSGLGLATTGTAWKACFL